MNWPHGLVVTLLVFCALVVWGFALYGVLEVFR